MPDLTPTDDTAALIAEADRFDALLEDPRAAQRLIDRLVVAFEAARAALSAALNPEGGKPDAAVD